MIQICIPWTPARLSMGAELNIYSSLCMCVSERAGFHAGSGHQSAVNFRSSRGTATKSIIEVMNVLLGTGISV